MLGYPYVINQDMADVQASNKSLAFGDWSKFMVRDVRNPLIIRANELYLTTGSVAYFLFSRHGSNVLDAGTDPIKHGTHPSRTNPPGGPFEAASAASFFERSSPERSKKERGP
jgi:hypothetical protein